MNGLLTYEEAQEFIKQSKGGRAAATPTKAPPARAKGAAKRPAGKKSARQVFYAWHCRYLQRSCTPSEC